MLFSNSVPCYLEKFSTIFEELQCFYFKFEIISYSINQEKKDLFEKKKEEDIIEKKKKEELIKKIRELEKIPIPRNKGYDPTETSNFEVKNIFYQIIKQWDMDYQKNYLYLN